MSSLVSSLEISFGNGQRKNGHDPRYDECGKLIPDSDGSPNNQENDEPSTRLVITIATAGDGSSGGRSYSSGGSSGSKQENTTLTIHFGDNDDEEGRTCPDCFKCSTWRPSPLFFASLIVDSVTLEGTGFEMDGDVAVIRGYYDSDSGQVVFDEDFELKVFWPRNLYSYLCFTSGLVNKAIYALDLNYVKPIGKCEEPPEAFISLPVMGGYSDDDKPYTVPVTFGVSSGDVYDAIQPTIFTKPHTIGARLTIESESDENEERTPLTTITSANINSVLAESGGAGEELAIVMQIGQAYGTYGFHAMYFCEGGDMHRLPTPSGYFLKYTPGILYNNNIHTQTIAVLRLCESSEFVTVASEAVSGDPDEGLPDYWNLSPLLHQNWKRRFQVGSTVYLRETGTGIVYAEGEVREDGTLSLENSTTGSAGYDPDSEIFTTEYEYTGYMELQISCGVLDYGEGDE